MTEENNDKKDEVVNIPNKGAFGPKILMIVIFLSLIFLFKYYKQQINHPVQVTEVLNTEPLSMESQVNQKIDCPKVDCPIVVPVENNNKQLISLVNLLIAIENGEDFTSLIEVLASQTKDQSINNKIKLLVPLASFGISKLALFDQLNMIGESAIAPIKINSIEFSYPIAKELLSKLITIKRFDKLDHDNDLEKIKMAKKYLLDNQIEKSIEILDNIDNEAIKEWVVKAKNKQQIDFYAKSIFNSICEQLK